MYCPNVNVTRAFLLKGKMKGGSDPISNIGIVSTRPASGFDWAEILLSETAGPTIRVG